MSNNLTTSQILGLLERLKAEVEECARTEQKLVGDFQAQIESLGKRRREGLKQLEAKLAIELSEAETRLIAQSDAAREQYRRWSGMISKAHKKAHTQSLRWIEEEEGRLKYPLQKGLLETKRWRTESLERNDARWADVQRRVDESQRAFDALRGQTERAFRGYRSFRKYLLAPPGGSDLRGDEDEMLQELQNLELRIGGELQRFRRSFLPSVFRHMPLMYWAALLIVAGIGLPFVLSSFGVAAVPWQYGGGVAGGIFLGVLALYFLGQGQTKSLAWSISSGLARAVRLHEACLHQAHARHEAEIQRIESEANARTQAMEEQWRNALQEGSGARELLPKHLEEKAWRLSVKADLIYKEKLQRLATAHEEITQKLNSQFETTQSALCVACDQDKEKLTASYDADWVRLEGQWAEKVVPLYTRLQTISSEAQEEFPAWDASQWSGWASDARSSISSKFGQAEVQLKQFCQMLPQDERLGLPSDKIALPLVLRYPEEGLLLFETTKGGSSDAVGAINSALFRLLTSAPPGRVSLTIIDPVGLGQNFAAIMHLADYEEKLINGRIWTEPNQIEERLAELNEHMEKVIQKCLRNEYANIAEYNRQAGKVAEKYHFLVIADFPTNFSDTAYRRLQRIITSGPRCGVFTLIHHDARQTPPPELLGDDLRKQSVWMTEQQGQFRIGQMKAPGLAVKLDAPPKSEAATELLRKIGESTKQSARVEVPFEHVAPAPEKIWSLDVGEELRVPIGRSGANRLQHLALGKGTRQHVLIAGKTGSGKSTLLHVIVTNLALWASPDEVEFYLIDFKKGVEFKSYAALGLPHARVIAIESDREFGLSVLERVDEELKRRSELFREARVQDLASYRKAPGAIPLPRTLLIIDEFQEFFVEDDRVSQGANALLDRIVRQGRAFGIHVILGSQTLGGAYTLARATMGQMVVRIALQCNEADAYLIMDENNAAPRMLSRPGEGIYNDQAGSAEANSPFQTVWLEERERERALHRIKDRTEQGAGVREPAIVFEGNVPADVSENGELGSILAADGNQPIMPARVWLGSPNSIKGPTEVLFPPASGTNLLIVGQREDAIANMLGVGALSLALQAETARVIFIRNRRQSDDSITRRLAQVPSVTVAQGDDEIARVVHETAEGMDGQDARETFIIIQSLQELNNLWVEDDFSFSTEENPRARTSAEFQKILAEGPRHGVHVISSIDSYNNVVRALGRKGLGHFQMRVLFQMSANDSASLCDDPKANMLGQHRALLYNEQEGSLETFRPYATPPETWWEQAIAAAADRKFRAELKV